MVAVDHEHEPGIDIAGRLQPPSAAHWFGTDSLGRDIASLLLVGARNALVVGLLAVGLGALTGIALGLLAAARGGWVDEALMRLSDFAFAFPALLTAIMLGAIHGPGLFTVVTAIGLFNLPVFARITRGAARAVWARDFVLASRACGKGAWHISMVHVLPNIASALIVQATIQFATAILTEAAPGYLGLGIQPPEPSWGLMLKDARNYLAQAPWMAIYPGLALALTVLCFNILGDTLAEIINPKLS